MFKNALVYRIEHWDQPALPEIESRLAGARFIECGAAQPESAGWVAPRGEQHAALAENIEVCESMDIETTQAIAVGDGANDLPMMLAAGLSIAYHPKPALREQAMTCIDSVGMERALLLFNRARA